MEKISVFGGNKLFGKTSIGGMKNSALPIIFACLLIEDECIIDNVPIVSDVINSLEILKGMGATAEFVDIHSVKINAKGATNVVKDNDLVSKMRASSYLMGACLAKMGGVEIPMPGGCNFGARPIDLHLKGFEALGAKCLQNGDYIKISSKENIKNGKIVLDKISVGATINTVLASVFAKGTVEIENVACEPHVDDVINFLNSCGANIVRSVNKITVYGVEKLHGTRYKIYPDMIEALTYITCVGVCSGKIELSGIEYSHLSYCCDIFRKMGFEILNFDNRVIIKSGKLNGCDAETLPYPYFPTDLHPQFASLLCFTKDGGKIKENIFPNRFAYLAELEKMGAKTEKNGNTVTVYPSELTGCELDATDLRAGASLIVAALGAKGNSKINNVNYIVRGYENIVEKISSLGGMIKYV